MLYVGSSVEDWFPILPKQITLKMLSRVESLMREIACIYSFQLDAD